MWYVVYEIVIDYPAMLDRGRCSDVPPPGGGAGLPSPRGNFLALKPIVGRDAGKERCLCLMISNVMI